MLDAKPQTGTVEAPESRKSVSVREHTGKCSLHLGEIEVLDEAVGLRRVSSKAMKSPRTVSLSS